MDQLDDRGPEFLSPRDETGGPGNGDAVYQSEATISCNTCRRRKLKCSREAGACQNCRKTGSECVYVSKRAKPGVKPGVYENIHRRLDELEKSVSRLQSSTDGVGSTCTHSSTRGSENDRTTDGETRAYRALSFFAKEFQRFNDKTHPPTRSGQISAQGDVRENSDDDRARKRRRGNDSMAMSPTPGPSSKPHHLPPSDLLQPILQVYFSRVHPWIPMIHEGRLRQRLLDPSKVSDLEVVLHAICLVAVRFVKAGEVSAGPSSKTVQGRESRRNWIVSTAMADMTVENLQALTIVAFNDVGNGETSKAWSIVGSLTRTVEYMQLTVEHGEHSDWSSLLQPSASLSPSQSWTETEERRRVFWNIFNLDRFCSVSMGWNTSLTSDDVRRRLPCDGVHWRKENPVSTPYFGIWDKSAARIGNPITFLPTRYMSPSQNATTAEEVRAQGTTAAQAAASPEGFSTATMEVLMSTVGAFAYSIEATESLSRVTTYFLQQKVNFRDQRDIHSWLTRFKELDLRLVHWKMLLPSKWKANMETRPSTTTIMDPNLTLAHVTHNTSMILLHQPIAFPPTEWEFKNKLPSSSSAETCHSAAVEIATITENYLGTTSSDVPLSSQYAFCVYVAARVLLVQWKFSGVAPLTEEFWSLVRFLDEMSRRWAGDAPAGDTSNVAARTDLAATYASRLREICHLFENQEGYDISVLSYTQDAYLLPRPAHIYTVPNHRREEGPETNVQDFDFQGQSLNEDLTSQANTDLGSISQLLLDQQFLDLDRIISFDDGMFDVGLDGGGW